MTDSRTGTRFANNEPGESFRNTKSRHAKTNNPCLSLVTRVKGPKSVEKALDGQSWNYMAAKQGSTGI